MSSPQPSDGAGDPLATLDHDLRDQADIELLHGLVAIPSLSGGEADAVRYLTNEMAARGFATEIDTAGNAIGRIGSGDRHVVLLGHIDTVSGWITPHILGGILHGRGAVDAKGPLATFVAAATRAADQLSCRVTVVGATGEESLGSPGATEVATWAAPDLCIIGEPSGWDAVCLGYRGSMTVHYRLTQDGRHTAGPGLGAAEQAIAFWNDLTGRVDAINATATGEGVFTRVTPSIRSFRTEADGLSESAHLVMGFRLPPGTDVEGLIEAIRTAAGGAEITVEGYQLGYRSDRRSPLSAPFLRSIRAEGGTPRFNVKLGTSDMNVVGPAWGCPIVAYGPGDAALDHTPDEHIVLDDYLRGVRVLTAVLTSL
ncbi:MAG TPA: [LysW]-lysine hydrolase [Thermomicrobiales bacterium]|jgi:LysW-gamma-L-lysine carboxypeptidase|nr:[LysW]-lysine hydrolase [Thermomicrobiales bacterium]